MLCLHCLDALPSGVRPPVQRARPPSHARTAGRERGAPGAATEPREVGGFVLCCAVLCCAVPADVQARSANHGQPAHRASQFLQMLLLMCMWHACVRRAPEFAEAGGVIADRMKDEDDVVAGALPFLAQANPTDAWTHLGRVEVADHPRCVSVGPLAHKLAPPEALSSSTCPAEFGGLPQVRWPASRLASPTRGLVQQHMFCIMRPDQAMFQRHFERQACERTCGTLHLRVCLHVRARVHCLPLTTPPSASAAAPPPPPHTIFGIDGCRTQCGGCAVLGGALCRKGGQTDWRQSIASTRVEVQHSAPPAPPARATVTRTPTQTDQAPNHTRGEREEAQRSTCRRGTQCLSVPFGKPRPLAGRARTALSSHQYLTLQRRALTYTWLAQKRANYPNHLANLALTIWPICL